MKTESIDYKKLAEEIAENSQFQKCMTEALTSDDILIQKDGLYTIKEACNYLGIKRRALHLWRSRGEMEWMVLPGGGVRFKGEQILKLLKRSSNTQAKEGGNYDRD